MNRLLHGGVTLLALSSVFLAAQAAPQRKKGTIYKNEIDKMVAVIREQSHGGALGGDSIAATAQILTAMGYCHRRYYRGDGPVVRPSLDTLIRARKSDGSFGDFAATAWAAEALAVMDGDAYKDEVKQARTWLARQDEKVPTFQGAVDAVIAEVRADTFPQQLGAPVLAAAGAWLQKPDSIDREKAAAQLLQLVACQAANKALDQQGAADGKTAFSPVQEKAFQFLMKQQQDGVFSATYAGKTFPDPAFTGFGLFALQTKPKALRTADEQKAIENGLRWLLKNQNEDGTFGQQLANYTTCAAVAALSRWDDPAVGPALARAQKAILSFQNVESTSYQSSDRDYGSIGYGGAQRGDLSNLHFALQALKDTGLPDDSEAFAKAIVFLQRTQNLKSVNDFKGKVPDPDREGVILDSTSGDDGGAGYYPGNSAAGYLVTPDGKSSPRSYGTMTYALLKAYTLCGVKGDDPRVQAAVKWICEHWDLATNPGADPAFGEKVKYQGLYYYYMVLAQALSLAKVETVDVVTADGKVAVAWKKALAEHLAKVQQPDGSWVNGQNDRWMEGLSLLCTCYAMIALEHCE